MAHLSRHKELAHLILCNVFWHRSSFLGNVETGMNGLQVKIMPNGKKIGQCCPACGHDMEISLRLQGVCKIIPNRPASTQSCQVGGQNILSVGSPFSASLGLLPRIISKVILMLLAAGSFAMPVLAQSNIVYAAEYNQRTNHARTARLVNRRADLFCR